MASIQMTSLHPAPAGVTVPAPRAGGLRLSPKKHMTPCFALLALFLVIDVATLVVPFYASRFTDSPWGSADRMGFLARAMASALAFGFVAAVAAERRNHSSWWFLLGHVGFPLALIFAFAGFDVARDRGIADPRGPTGAAAAVILAGFLGTVITLLATRRTRPELPPMGPVQAGISRFMYQWGNIWLGIGLMVVIGATVAVGTFLENRYGTKAAQYLVYRSPFFGAVFFAGGISMLCATFRKYPFRLEQAGWLTVHSGLAMIVIGGMASFLSSVEGEVSIREGESADSFRSSTQTRLTMSAIVTRSNGTRTAIPLLRTISDFDVNPTMTAPNRRYEIATGDGEPPVSLVVDRYFGIGEPYTKWTDDGSFDRVGVELDLVMGQTGRTDRIRLEEAVENQTSLPFGSSGFSMSLFRATRPFFDALTRATKPEGHGRIVVRDEAGKDLLVLPVEPPAGERHGGQPATLKASGRIPGTEVDVKLLAYYDQLRPDRAGQKVVDGSPGNPLNPAVALEIAGPAGTDSRTALAFFPDEHHGLGLHSGEPKHPYRVTYECEPRADLDSPALLFAELDGKLRWIFASTSGERTSGDTVVGEDLPIPVPAFRIRPAAIFRKLRIEQGYEFKGYKAENQVIRVSVTAADGMVADPIWLALGSSRTFALGDRTFNLSWGPISHPLGFSLKLHDFHRDFYPGSTEESSFESYCRLTHPTKFPAGEDVKIDMNHPLRLDGWRLFQSRFGGDGRTTILQVNRDPGLLLTYPACAVVLLGLIVVFFMKPTLRLKRRDLELRGATPARHFAWAVGSVAAVGIGPTFFGLYAATHESLGLPLSGWPAFAFGVIFLIVIPIGVVWTFIRPMHRRLAAALAPAAAPGGSQ